MRHESNPHSAATVIIVSVSDDMMDTIREALAADAVLPNKAADFVEGMDLALRSMPDVVLVGMDDDPAQAIEFARQVRKENGRLTLVAVASSRDADRILGATRAGFGDYIKLPEERGELRAAVQKAAFRPDEHEGKGMVVAIIGAKGGVGCTMLSTHLSAELAGIHRVLCIDLDRSMGDIAPSMDIIPKDTLADLLPKAAQADERMVSATVVVHPSKVHFLCQPDDIDVIESVSSEDMYNLLNASAQGYQYVVLDVGDVVSDAEMVAVNAADQVLLVTTPDVVAVRDAHRLLKQLVAAGVERKRVGVVLNRMPKQPFLTRDTIESNLGVRVVGTIPDDARRVDHAVNEGKLIRELYPKAEIVTEIARLVGVLSEDPEELSKVGDEDGGGLGGLFGKLFGGKKK